MSKFYSAVLLFVALVSILSFENCGGTPQATSTANRLNPTSNTSAMQINGTVQKLNLDGCSYVICAVDNTDGQTKCFIPQGIDPSLLNAGNVVTVDGYLRNDILTACMAGSVIQVTDAKLVSGTTVPPSSP